MLKLLKKLGKKLPFLSKITKQRNLLLEKNNILILENSKLKLKVLISQTKSPYKIVVGANNIYQKNWVPTEKNNLDITNEDDWKLYFNKNSIDSILAEHVWEHLPIEKSFEANFNCFKYLKKGGLLRIAVPDGFNPDKSYIKKVKLGIDDHKILYNYRILKKELEQAGFEVKLLEYWNEKGEFEYNEWDEEEGLIIRSSRFDERNKINKLSYTSLIVDAIKI